MENKNSKSEALLWGLIILIFIAGIGGNCYFSSQSALLRLIAVLTLVGVAIFLAAKTAMVKIGWEYWQEALVEVRKVVWPTKKETMQATFGVLAMTLVLGLLLWTVDSILIRFIAWVIGH